MLDCETERESTTVLCTGIDPRWLAEKGARRRPIWMKKVDDNERTINTPEYDSLKNLLPLPTTIDDSSRMNGRESGSL